MSRVLKSKIQWFIILIIIAIIVTGTLSFTPTARAQLADSGYDPPSRISSFTIDFDAGTWSATALCGTPPDGARAGQAAQCLGAGSSLDGPVVNGYTIALEQDTSSSFTSPTVLDSKSTPGPPLTGSVSGTFTVPTAPGTYYFRAHHATQKLYSNGQPCTSGPTCNTWPETVSSTESLTIVSQGTLKIVKNTDGGEGTFWFTGAGQAGSFSIVTGSPTAGTGSVSFSVAPGTTYGVSEASQSGWKFVSVSCKLKNGDNTGSVDGASVTGITVNAGETTTCTFTDRKLGTIVVQKSATGPDASSTIFTFTVSWVASPGTFTISGSGSQTFNNIDPDVKYTASESVTVGWKLTGISCTNQDTESTGFVNGVSVSEIAVDPGGTTTCVFSDKQLGQVTISKTAVGGSGTFSFTVSKTGTESTTTNTGSFGFPPSSGFSVASGSPVTYYLDPDVTYAFSETVPEGWKFVSASCNSFPTSNTGVSGITVSPGGSVSCAFNDKKLGTIVVVKTAVGGGDGTFNFGSLTTGTSTGVNSGTLLPGSFSVTTSGGSGTTPTSPPYFLDPDLTYTLYETVPSGWTLASFSCKDANNNPVGSITGSRVTFPVQPGVALTCSFTNAHVTVQGSMTDSSFAPIPNNQVDVVFTQCTQTQCKLTATNPGTYYLKIQITNYGTTGTFTLQITLPSQLVLKPLNGNPVQIDSPTSAGLPATPVTYTLTGNTLNVPDLTVTGGGGMVTLWVHLDYALKGTTVSGPNLETTYFASYAFPVSVNSGIPVDGPSALFAGKRVTGIYGFVMDTNGLPKGGLNIAVSPCSGTCSATTAALDGFYMLTIGPGTYTVTVSGAQGGTYTKPNVAVVQGQVTEASFNNLNPADPAIQGIVKDQFGNGVKGATVQLLDRNGRVLATTATNGAGFYIFRFSAPGTYTVRIIVPAGYSSATTDITVTVKQFQTVTVNFSLTKK